MRRGDKSYELNATFSERQHLSQYGFRRHRKLADRHTGITDLVILAKAALQVTMCKKNINNPFAPANHRLLTLVSNDRNHRERCISPAYAKFALKAVKTRIMRAEITGSKTGIHLLCPGRKIGLKTFKHGNLIKK